MLAIKAWRNSPAALTCWFGGVYSLAEYLQTFDPQTATKVCEAHLMAQGKCEIKSNDKVINSDAVASDGSISYMRVWYNEFICTLQNYFFNASNLWLMFH